MEKWSEFLLADVSIPPNSLLSELRALSKMPWKRKAVEWLFQNEGFVYDLELSTERSMKRKGFVANHAA